ncbi:hypothetical protein CAPN001_17410 [Capnocytophaga stomatis]|uniref:hypothetical protein n=1 Tax=Capnocytophaga stomatis TaxID=1848904 RepID=UPI00194DB1A5|nr:hypothetical protein [Capnocytophaga stomatis]GIJ97172.1 hypothetical protein CAPN001_17410 [Capnocytophaga stomatis]GIM49491.1 hypothetical protein CAPN003_09430 [Capnocytophaga stomatis]
MKIQDYNNVIVSKIKSLLNDFEQYISEDGTLFLKNNSNKSFFGFSWFMSENHKSVIFIRNTIYWVYYVELESILQEILVKNSLKGKGDIEGTYGSFIIDNKESNIIPYDENLGMAIDSKTYDSVINRLKNIISLEALPFFEKWHSLNVLYEYIKDKTDDELWDILGQFAPMKKAVILKLCNDSNYQPFMDNYFQKQKEYFEEDPEDIDNIRYYNASKELKEILDKTEPIYNL